MTMRSLGDFMGVDATAVYRHFPTKEKLIEAMVDWFFGEVRVRAEAEMGDALPRQRCIAFAQSYRESFAMYPNIGIAVSTSSGNSINGYFCTQIVVDALTEMGLRGDDLVISYQGLEGFVLGSCMQDFIGAPHNWETRRNRYRALDNSDFDSVATSADRVKQIADLAFHRSLNELLDRCESHVK